jgi:exodeoxyribonuclease VII large subunit
VIQARIPEPGGRAPKTALDGSPILSVTELTRMVRETLERHVGSVWVSGEISNFRSPGSGHLYFTLKDEGAQISAVMWRALAAGMRFRIEEGLAVVAQGEVTVYEPRGQYQIVIRRMDPLGVGALQLAFLQLKERLEKEGLFDPARKRPLPFFPRTVAVITSPTGAAVQDILRVLRRRCPMARVIVHPVRVQGTEAAGEIAEAIRTVNRMGEAEVMIVGRGGGSLEDLWPFNEEVVARAIATSRVPVISAVGHETDFTISDFAADVRALTPTDAAHMVVPDVRELGESLRSLRDRLAQSLIGRVTTAWETLGALQRSLAPRRFLESIRQREQRVDDLCQQLVREWRHRTELSQGRLEGLSSRLESLSPLAVLKRGYSVTLREADRKVVRDAARVKDGEVLLTRLDRGTVRSKVEATQK